MKSLPAEQLSPIKQITDKNLGMSILSTLALIVLAAAFAGCSKPTVDKDPVVIAALSAASAAGANTQAAKAAVTAAEAKLPKFVLPSSLNFTERVKVPRFTLVSSEAASTDHMQKELQQVTPLMLRLFQGDCSALQAIADLANHDPDEKAAIAFGLLAGRGLPPDVPKAIAMLDEMALNRMSLRQTNVLAYAAGFLSDGPYSEKTSKYLEALSMASLSVSDVQREYARGVLTKRFSSSCDLRAVYPSRSGSDAIPLLARVLSANTEATNELRLSAPVVVSVVKNEFESTTEFEARKGEAEKLRKEQEALAAKDRPRRLLAAAGNALGQNLDPLQLKDLKYDANRQAFNGTLSSLRGEITIPVIIPSPSKEAQFDKDELSKSSITFVTKVDADGELVIVQWRTYPGEVAFAANGEWKTGFRFGQDHSAAIEVLAKAKAALAAAETVEKNAALAIVEAKESFAFNQANPEQAGSVKLTSKFICRSGTETPSESAMKTMVFDLSGNMSSYYDEKGEDLYRFTLFKDGSSLMRFKSGKSHIRMTWATTPSGYELINPSGEKMVITNIKQVKAGNSPIFQLSITVDKDDFMGSKVWMCVGEGAVAFIDSSAKSAAAKSQTLADKESAPTAPLPQRVVTPNEAIIEKVRRSPVPYCDGIAVQMEQMLSLGREDKFYEFLGKAQQRGCI